MKKIDFKLFDNNSIRGLLYFVELFFVVGCFEIVYFSFTHNYYIEVGLAVLVLSCYYIIYSLVEYIFYKIKQLKEEGVIDEKKVD